MKYRIIRQTFYSGSTPVDVYFAQKKAALGLGWKNLKMFYKSDFSDMPGWWTETFSDTDGAYQAINRDKRAKSESKISVIHEE